MNPALELDHVGVAVRDLERGRAAYARLGFRLTARSLHSGSRVPGAPVEPWGSGNHCAMLRDGYVEVIGLTDATKYSSVKDMVDRYEGAHIVAIGAVDVDAAREALRAQGVPVEEARSLERDAAFGPRDEETRRARFRNCYVDRQRYTEARFLYIQHLTREVLWQPHLLEHPNDALGIDEVFFLTDDVPGTSAKLAPMLPAGARGRFRILSPGQWPFGSLPPLPSPAGFGIRVGRLAATRECLERNAVPYSPKPDGIWVAPDMGCGAAIRFFEKETQ